MNEKNNAKIALNEIGQMFGVEFGKKAEAEKSLKAVPNTAPRAASANNESETALSSIAAAQKKQWKDKPSSAVEKITFAEKEPAPELSTTIIAADMKIVGNVAAMGNVELRGSVEGNIETEGKVSISGKLLGNIKCKSVLLSAAQMHGNITTTGDVHINNNSVLIGNVTAANINLDGKLKGLLEIQELASIKENAVLIGNVTATTISIAEGALITGEISTKKMDATITEGTWIGEEKSIPVPKDRNGEHG